MPLPRKMNAPRSSALLNRAQVRRLTTTVGAALFVRSGRGLVLTSRGERLRTALHGHLQALVDAALAPPVFDPATSVFGQSELRSPPGSTLR